VRYEYTARLVPLGRAVNVPKIDGTPWYYTFDHRSFAWEQESKRTINVCLRHELHKVIGKVETLLAQDGWWQATFRLNAGLRSELSVGGPVSIGLDAPDGVTPLLTEVSLVRHGAVEGARIIGRSELPPPATPKPTPPPPPPNRTTNQARRRPGRHPHTTRRRGRAGRNHAAHGPHRTAHRTARLNGRRTRRHAPRSPRPNPRPALRQALPQPQSRMNLSVFKIGNTTTAVQSLFSLRIGLVL